MTELLQEIVSTYLIPAAVTAIGGILAYLGARIKAIYEEKVKDEKIREIVYDVVLYIERTMKSDENQAKFQAALDRATSWLGSKGYDVDPTELALLIEASVNNLPKTNK